MIEYKVLADVKWSIRKIFIHYFVNMVVPRSVKKSGNASFILICKQIF